VSLQSVPRAPLILRDVLRRRAAEVAELLGTTVASINRALLPARSNIAARDRTADESRSMDDRQCELVRGQVDAFGRCELELLVWLLR
jgi:RNA polymerase sigma-70 factor, ECF subfamily